MLKNWIDNKLNRYLQTLPSAGNLWQKIAEYEKAIADVHSLRCRSDEFLVLYAALRDTMRPVVLFKACSSGCLPTGSGFAHLRTIDRACADIRLTPTIQGA